MAVNNPATSAALMTAMQQIIYVGTSVSSASNVYIRQFNQMVAGSFPAINLTGSGWARARESRSTYAGTQHIRAGFYNNFGQTSTPIEDLWSAAVADVEMMAANLENNETLLVGSVEYAITISGMSFGPDDTPKKIITENGLQLLEAELVISYLILPYDVADIFPG